MDELQARLAAVEGLLMERLALDPPGVLQQLATVVRGWPEGDERAQALQWLDDAVRRYDEFNSGFRLPPST